MLTVPLGSKYFTRIPCKILLILYSERKFLSFLFYWIEYTVFDSLNCWDYLGSRIQNIDVSFNPYTSLVDNPLMKTACRNLDASIRIRTLFQIDGCQGKSRVLFTPLENDWMISHFHRCPSVFVYHKYLCIVNITFTH